MPLTSAEAHNWAPDLQPRITGLLQEIHATPLGLMMLTNLKEEFSHVSQAFTSLQPSTSQHRTGAAGIASEKTMAQLAGGQGRDMQPVWACCSSVRIISLMVWLGSS